MFHKIIQPPESLNDVVQYFWLMEHHSEESSEFVVRSMCDCSSGIIIQHHEGKSAFIKNDNQLLTAFVYGPYTTPSLTLSGSSFSLTGVAFKPQALLFLFGIDASEFTDRMIPLNEFATEDLESRIIESDNREEHVQILSSFLQKKISGMKIDRKDPVISNSIQRIHSRSIGKKLTVGQLVRSSGLSKRQFERRFKRATGVLPKYYLRINRLSHTLNMMKAGHADKLTDIVYSLHYSDQSHFTKDIRELTGITPKHLLRMISRHNLVNHFTLPK